MILTKSTKVAQFVKEENMGIWWVLSMVLRSTTQPKAFKEIP